MNQENGKIKKASAILEIFAAFALVFLLIWIFRITPSWQWQRIHLKHEFMNSTLFLVIPILILLMTRRDFVAHGLCFKNLRTHLITALICLIPVGISVAPFAFVEHTSMSGSLVLAADHLLLLLVLALLLKKRLSPIMVVVFGTLFFGAITYVSFTVAPLPSPIWYKPLRFIYFLFFVGFCEEMFFRGYIQSRLNAVFGRPHAFLGVPWGWGLIISSLIFGLGHVFNHFNPFLGEFNWMWWWGFWTIFSGLVFGFIREKTGSILVSAIIHGLPLAIGSIYVRFE
ncbi:MAG: CPBP family intramembrane metalloprotease [Candidatus Latescibacteria bacterium]|nr:CPBP family intramembrane metalloprotease [Candidatus Latescibacterota bacterium]NIO56217.1 CPBP family intramembrane metalloprotease [Candidatus Latescibacterota bacterium]